MKFFKKANESQINPEDIEIIRELGSYTPEEIQKAKEETFSTLSEPLQQKEQVEKSFEEYRRRIKGLPYLQQSETFEQWAQDNPKVVQSILAKKDEIKMALQEKTISNNTQTMSEQELEQEVEHLLLKELQSTFQRDMLYKYYAPVLGLPEYQTEGYDPNSVKTLREMTAKMLSQHTVEQLNNPNSELSNIPRNGSLILVTGYSGAGKSTALTQNAGQLERVFSTPLEITPDKHVVIDVDNFSPFMPGWTGGARTEVQSYGNSASTAVLKQAMAQKLNVAIPLVGGTESALVGKITDGLINNYNSIKIIHVPTPYEESSKRVIQRALQPGGRVISPFVGESSDPKKVFDFLQTPEGAERIYKSYLTKVKSNKLSPNPEINPTTIPNYLQFETQSTDTTVANSSLKFIRTAAIMENIKQYSSADKLIKLSMDILAKYNAPRGKMKSRWSTKYKKSIDCNNPKGFSQKQYCKRKNSGGNYKIKA